MAPVSDRAEFPTVSWDAWTVTFEREIGEMPVAAPAVVVFARAACGFVLSDIPGRGWCTPSGRLEPGETHHGAAIRETWEEIGARVSGPLLLGRYVLSVPDEQARRIPAFVCDVTEFGAIPSGSESRGAKCFALEALETVYYRWDALIESVFALAAASSQE